ncbi:uncharacterized protein JCM6883_000395 [Sporobolomyces salmoneus]|uniref:uncharacterized protein n=1 Tax=Sporobolomyces salmoneus TaxID=183962 RepID=UPI003171EA94
MGIPSPTYYDQLLLTKCKLLLQAALANPKRRGGTFSFEEFVVGLDERDEGTIRTFEILLQETAVRRPRKTATANATTAVGSTSTETAADNTNSSRPTRRRRVEMIPLPPNYGRVMSDSETSDSSDSGTNDEITLRQGGGGEGGTHTATIARIIQNARNTSSRQQPGGGGGGDDRDARAVAAREGREARRAEWMRERRTNANQPVGIPIGRMVTTTTTSTNAAQGGGGTPSERLREYERGSLFGFNDEPPLSVSELLNRAPEIEDPPEIPQDLVTLVTTSNSPSDLPTFEELWNIVTESNDEPFPSESINSFDSFLNRLNATTALSSSSSSTAGTSTLLNARDMNGLLAELTLRDVSIPIRVLNAIQRRRTNDTLAAARAAMEMQLEEESASPLREGIWRVEVGPADEINDVADGNGGIVSFADWARRRRALTREREEEGATPSVNVEEGGGGGGVSTSMNSTTSASNQETPQSATTPATSSAPSPVAIPSCPAQPDRPLTSADRAIAAMRQQREIAPLRSSTSSSTAPGGSTPTEATGATETSQLEERLRRVRQTAWVERVIARGERLLAESN